MLSRRRTIVESALLSVVQLVHRSLRDGVASSVRTAHRLVRGPSLRPPRRPAVACLSLEAWDSTWRRNQHFASRLLTQGHVERLVFVEPAVPGRGSRRMESPGVVVVRPPLLLPKRLGGLRLTAALLRLSALRRVDVLWINDPTLGVHCLDGRPAVYDVTDDWREVQQADRIRRRIVAAEDRLTAGARVIVCSAVLSERWRHRYGVDVPVVQNAVDLAAVRRAVPRQLQGEGPHIGYVGTLHPQRVDVELVLDVAAQVPGTLHLVGPDFLPPDVRTRLAAAEGVLFEGSVPGEEVPAWTTAMDVLVCPHLVSPFTLSLDAIKAHEYLATPRPVVATASSGFQKLQAPGLDVVAREDFVAAVGRALAQEPVERVVEGWDERTHAFAAHLLSGARR